MNALFYCQNSMGIGHLTRTFKIAQAMSDTHDVQIICGGRLPTSLLPPENVKLLPLPEISMNPKTGMEVTGVGKRVRTVRQHRRLRLREYLASLRPDVLVVEMFPFGRKSFASEIVTLIKILRSRSAVKVYSSVRDVLVSRPKNQQRYDSLAVAWLNRHFDGLLIHSDQKVVSLADSFTAYHRIAIPIHYTGFVAVAPRPRPHHPDPVVVVSAGGGIAGRRLVETAVGASTSIKAATGFSTVVITGPNGAAIKPPSGAPCDVISFARDFPDLLARSALSISQCGYNTATDVLATGVPAVFVPFETAKEDEQIRRADLLARQGRSITLRESALTPEALTLAALQALKQSARPVVNLNGASNSAHILRAVNG